MRAGRPAMTSRVLIVEDDPALLTILAMSFEEAGFQVSAVESCQEAYALPDGTFKLALLDYQLPDGNGLELLAYLLTRTPQLPIIVMSAHSDPNLVTLAHTVGARAFLRKPLNGQDLRQVLDDKILDVAQGKTRLR